MDDLRLNCPWDKKQTLDSLKRLTVEETYELNDAIENKNFENIKEELGDLLLHIVFYSKIASEKNHFNFNDVVEKICEKLIERHPHVYGELKLRDAPALEERWSCFGDSFTEVNGRKTQCKSVQKLEDAVMATTSSHEFGMQKWRSYQSLEKSVKVTTTGSDCYNYGLLASGHIDLIAEKLTAPHDYLPLTKIVEGAGGIMTDWEGKKLGLHDKHVYVLASASEELHNLALEKLRTKE